MTLMFYIALAAVLFAIGAATVLTRRNGVIALLGIELMLSACNLAFITFSRMHGNLEGQQFRVLRHGCCRSRSCCWLGHHRVHFPNPQVCIARRCQPHEALIESR